MRAAVLRLLALAVGFPLGALAAEPMFRFALTLGYEPQMWHAGAMLFGAGIVAAGVARSAIKGAST